MLKSFLLLQTHCAHLTAGQSVPGCWQNLVMTLISMMQSKFIIVSKLQRADYMPLSTLELLQWPMCQMRTNVTLLRNEEGSYSVRDRVHKQWCNLYTHLTPTHITPVHLYIEGNIFSFCSLSFFLLFSEDFEGYSSYLCSSVAIFRMAQISGDPRLFLRLFSPLFACLLHLPPFDWVSEALCSAVYGWSILGHLNAFIYRKYSVYLCPSVPSCCGDSLSQDEDHFTHHWEYYSACENGYIIFSVAPEEKVWKQ